MNKRAKLVKDQRTLEGVNRLLEAGHDSEIGSQHLARRGRIGFSHYYRGTKGECSNCLELKLAGKCPAQCAGSVKELSMAMELIRELERS